MLVFSYCDRDYDYYVTVKELDDKERDEHFTKNIIQSCHLHDFIKYADNLETDGKLTVSEFIGAFGMENYFTFFFVRLTFSNIQHCLENSLFAIKYM